MFWLFLSGFDPSVDKDSVLAYLKELNGTPSYVCEKLNSRYDTYSSFKVGVPFELADELMHPNLWPQGCIVGKYRAPSMKPTMINGRPKLNDHFLDQTSQLPTQI